MRYLFSMRLSWTVCGAGLFFAAAVWAAKPAPVMGPPKETGQLPQPSQTAFIKEFPEKMSLEDFIKRADTIFYDFSKPDRMTHLREFLEARLKAFPTEVYTLWAMARFEYFDKETLYIREMTEKPKPDLLKDKLALAEKCHSYVDRCLAIAPENAECNLVKGACFAMECSTIGPSLAILPKIRKMDMALKRAIDLPSDFKHLRGLTTKVMAQTMLGIVYRVLPDTWWFYLLTGVRGNKDTAYKWTKEGVAQFLDHEPLFIMEVSAMTLCRSKLHGNDKALLKEGLDWIEKGLALPIRYPMDKFDQSNMRYLKAHPEEACNYRRERFEDTGDKLMKLTKTQ